MRPKVAADDAVEDVVQRWPDAVTFLMERGVRCIQCGEPAWGTLRELMARSPEEADKLIDALNAFLDSPLA